MDPASEDQAEDQAQQRHEFKVPAARIPKPGEKVRPTSAAMDYIALGFRDATFYQHTSKAVHVSVVLIMHVAHLASGHTTLPSALTVLHLLLPDT